MVARIRTIKPEFWDSPSVARASPWARLLFIAMWNWADDYGRGTANLKELEGFAFPLDDRFTDRSGNTVQFRALVAEVADCFGVMFYEVDSRPYFAIPTWDTHQRNERRAKQSKHPGPPMVVPKFDAVAEIPSHATEVPHSSGPGTGEQGNRGTEEQGNRGTDSSALSAPEIDSLFDDVYSRWPKKVERKKSLEKFRQVCRKRDPHELAADVARFGEAYAATTDVQFVPALVVWLGGERWTDALPEVRGQQFQPARKQTVPEKARAIVADMSFGGLEIEQ